MADDRIKVVATTYDKICPKADGWVDEGRPLGVKLDRVIFFTSRLLRLSSARSFGNMSFRILCGFIEGAETTI